MVNIYDRLTIDVVAFVEFDKKILESCMFLPKEDHGILDFCNSK